MTVLQTIKQIEQANIRCGQNFFNVDTMRFFSSVIESAVYFTNYSSYFITSEIDPECKAWFGNRRFTVRVANPTGMVKTHGEFGQYFDLDEAKMAVLDIIRTYES